MRAAYGTRDPAVVERTRQQYAILERSLAKLARAGAKIVLGADTGLEDHLFGMSEHRELESMVRAGMTPMDAIVAATGRAAEYMRLADRGVLAPGKAADFLVLDGNPLEDITATLRIARVVVEGREVDRAALATSLAAQR
jgi:imidazolonepropionase-like amidohydrolase